MIMDKIQINVQTGERTESNFTPEELAERETFTRDVLPIRQLEQLRQKRNQLLAETDYLALSDTTLTAEMVAYRQALRDLPANTVDPANPVWPVKPPY
jgi:hypothetical protein